VFRVGRFVRRTPWTAPAAARGVGVRGTRAGDPRRPTRRPDVAALPADAGAPPAPLTGWFQGPGADEYTLTVQTLLTGPPARRRPARSRNDVATPASKILRQLYGLRALA